MRLLMVILIGAALAGCSSGPSVSGVGILAHNVSEGDTVTVSFPYEPGEGREWRIASFDSAMLEPVGRPRVMQRSEREFEYLMRFRAKVPGETEVRFEREGLSPDEPETKTVTVRILPD